MILHLLDLKQYMYTGVSKLQTYADGVIEDSNKYRPREFRCGSLAYVIDEVSKLLKEKSSVVCFCIDTPPTIKREWCEKLCHRQYKGGRKSAPAHVTYQFEFAIEMIKEIGFNYVMLDGYEADDCIASVVRKYKNMYEKIVIHTNDSDQYYLISEKISIVPTSLRGKNVNIGNYESVVNKDRYVPYNTLTLDKMIFGESSDNIPYISDEMTRRIKNLIPKEANQYLGDNDILRTIVKNTCNNDEKTMAIFELIAPIEIIDSRVIVDPGIVYNSELFRYFGIEFQSYAFQRYNYFPNEVGHRMLDNFLCSLEDKGVI